MSIAAAAPLLARRRAGCHIALVNTPTVPDRLGQINGGRRGLRGRLGDCGRVVWTFGECADAFGGGDVGVADDGAAGDVAAAAAFRVDGAGGRECEGGGCAGEEEDVEEAHDERLSGV